ncbi:ferric reductase Fre2p [Fusarium beomiforme]|uniref:Ferric reductase Fre2p n=1 Tax=Fusarium beomiforme TaxID=44412 RepID=A0A9P5AS85_9HYPO|nr:ferric reductase Fre2p [Fusarium beomiforme]
MHQIAVIQTTGDKSVRAEWMYGAALANVTAPPTRTYIANETMNHTALIADDDYQYQFDFNVFFGWEEAVQSTYIIVLISIAGGTPVFFSGLGYLPFMTRAIDKIKPYLIYPSTFRGYNIRPLPYLLGNTPTTGQGLLIAMFIILSIILGAVSYKNFPYLHSWGSLRAKSEQASSHSRDVELDQKIPQIVTTHSATGTNSISLYIKKHCGTKILLNNKIALLVLLEDTYRGDHSHSVLKCDRILLTGGGIGITGLLSWMHSHVNVKLGWSLKGSSQPLLYDLEPAISGLDDKIVLVGE